MPDVTEKEASILHRGADGSPVNCRNSKPRCASSFGNSIAPSNYHPLRNYSGRRKNRPKQSAKPILERENGVAAATPSEPIRNRLKRPSASRSPANRPIYSNNRERQLLSRPSAPLGAINSEDRLPEYRYLAENNWPTRGAPRSPRFNHPSRHDSDVKPRNCTAERARRERGRGGRVA